MTSEPRSFTVAEDDDGIRLDRWFKRHLPAMSASTWCRAGPGPVSLRIDGKRAAPGDRIETGQVHPHAAARAPRRRRAPGRSAARPLTEDEATSSARWSSARRDACVLNKPPGLATQGGTKTSQHLDRLLDGLADDAGNGPSWSTGSTRIPAGVLLVARSARARGPFSALCRANRAQGLLGDRRGVPSARKG